jgi:RNA binding motif
LTTKANVIVDAILKPAESKMEISGDHKKVRRLNGLETPKLGFKKNSEEKSRTVLASSFPLKVKLNQILNFLQRNYPEVLHVIMRHTRRHKEEGFNGTVLITFETIEAARELVEKQLVTFCNRDIKRQMLQSFTKNKLKVQSQMKEPKKPKESQKEEEAPPAKEILHFSVVAGNTPITREDILAKFNEKLPDATVDYVSYSRGNTEGSIVLRNKEENKKFMQTLTDGKVLKLIIYLNTTS